MTYLLDTCIISKLRKLQAYPNPKLEEWFVKHPSQAYYLSVVTLLEIQAGISKLDPSQDESGKNRMKLEEWLFSELMVGFKDRILPVSPEVALLTGQMMGEGKRKGRAVPLADGIIAATALHYGFIVITDNTKDFAGLVETINPLVL